MAYKNNGKFLTEMQQWLSNKSTNVIPNINTSNENEHTVFSVSVRYMSKLKSIPDLKEKKKED